MTKWTRGYDTGNYPAISLPPWHSGSPSTSIQAMVAKRRSLTERFSYCLTQFTRDYNWICRCINKKSSENLNSFAATGHKVLQACRCGFRAGLRASRWFWVRALGCGVLSQSTSGPPRVTTWSNSGKSGQCGRVAKEFTYAGGIAVGLEQPASSGRGWRRRRRSRRRGLRYQPRDRKRNRLNLWRPPRPAQPASLCENAPFGVILAM